MMMKKTQRLRRTQLDRIFESATKSPLSKRPKAGWIHEIRSSLGMSMQDLASRMGVIRQRVERIEKDEMLDKLTLETVKRVAEALECDFVYYLKPKTSLQKTLEKQAEVSAKIIAARVNQSMALEEQKVSAKSEKAILEDIKDELLRKEDKRIWRTK